MRGPSPAREKPFRRKARAFTKRAELGPHHILGNTAHARRGIEATVGAGDDSARVADRTHDPLDALRDHLWVLDEVGERVDDTRHHDLIFGERRLSETASFMGMAWVGEWKHQRPNPGLAQDWQDFSEWNVAVVRRLIVTPANVHPHSITRDGFECSVDGRYHFLDKLEERAERPLLERDMAFKREIGAVELQHEAFAD